MAEILDGPPSIRDRVVEQAEYIRLLEEKLAEAKNRHAEHLAAHRTADAHDCAEMEEMYQREKAEVERLRAAVREAQSLESVNREREKRGLPIIYNPTVYADALAGKE